MEVVVILRPPTVPRANNCNYNYYNNYNINDYCDDNYTCGVLFFYSLFTCVSVTPNIFAISDRSDDERYFFSSNCLSSSNICRPVNVVRAFFRFRSPQPSDECPPSLSPACCPAGEPEEELTNRPGDDDGGTSFRDFFRTGGGATDAVTVAVAATAAVVVAAATAAAAVMTLLCVVVGND